MSLLNRLIGIEKPRLAIFDILGSAMAINDGNMNELDAKNQFGLTSGSDLSEWNSFYALYLASPDKSRFLIRAQLYLSFAQRSLFGNEVKDTIWSNLQSIDV